MRTLNYFAVLAALLAVVPAGAQNPPGIEWRHILIPHFDVVFPSGSDAQANRSADLLETFYPPMSDSFGIRPKRTTVIIENRDIVRNIGGFVNLSPMSPISTRRGRATITATC